MYVLISHVSLYWKELGRHVMISWSNSSPHYIFVYCNIIMYIMFKWRWFKVASTRLPPRGQLILFAGIFASFLHFTWPTGGWWMRAKFVHYPARAAGQGFILQQFPLLLSVNIPISQRPYVRWCSYLVTITNLWTRTFTVTSLGSKVT